MGDMVKKEIKFLKFYSGFLTIILLFTLFYIISKTKERNFNEITVERINIVEPNGDLKMVISCGKKQHLGMMDGKTLVEREREPGIIFFNEEQDEVGGLVYGGNKKKGYGMVLSFDQYKNDQIMQMQYLRGVNGKQQYGMNIWDRSETVTLSELMSKIDSLKKEGITDNQKITAALKKMNNGDPIVVQRLFTGKNFNEEVGMFIKDHLGNSRINIFVDKNNNPKFQILDKNGEIVKELISEE